MALPTPFTPYQFPHSRLGSRHVQKADLLRDLESMLDLLERQVDPLSAPATLQFLDDTDLPDKTLKYAHPSAYYLDRSSVAPVDGINVIYTATGVGRWIIADLSGPGGGGITPDEHEFLNTLTHDIVENSHLEVIRTAGQVTKVIVWTSPAKTIKRRDADISRTAGQVTLVVERQYDDAGALMYTLTHSISRTAGQVTVVNTVRS